MMHTDQENPLPRPLAPTSSAPTLRVVYTRQPSPLGDVVLAASEQGLVGCWFHDQAHFPNMQAWQRDDRHALLRQAHQQWTAYFNGDLQQFDLSLHHAWGTPFQQQVWAALERIPYGKTASYADIAQAVGRPTAFRAVGAAVGRNPWSLVVPCHRVMGTNGALTGYAGGLQRKKSLLALEAQHA